VLANTATLIKESRGTPIDFDALPLDDAKTYQLLSEARTFGVFQLESAGMRDALRGLRPERLEDLIAMVSLYRPGPMDLIPDFIGRKHGRAKITYEHPAMEKFTRETYGIMVYQEQIMQIASEMAGFTMGEADTLRRAMGKKDRDLMATQRAKFLSGCAERGTAAAKAERVWELMEKFAGYGFNKCITADSLIEMADGSLKPVTEIREGDRVLTKDGIFAARGVRSSGVRRVGRLKLANGMAVRCTADHPIFTQRGWVDAGNLEPTDFVAVARELPSGHQAVPDHLPGLLGYALSEGGLNYEGHFYLHSTVEDELADMAGVLEAFPNTIARIERRPAGKASSVRPVRMDKSAPSSAVRFLFQDCGLHGRKAGNKRVPAVVDSWNVRAIAVLIGKLLQGDGCIHPKTKSIYYATSSEGLAEDVRRLFLKLGIASTIHRKSFAYRGGLRVGFTVNVLGGRAAYAALGHLVARHLVGAKRSALQELITSYDGLTNLRARGTVDIIPSELYLEPLREAILKKYETLDAGCRDLGIAYRLIFGDRQKHGIRRDTLGRIAFRLVSPALHDLADAPVAWSRLRAFVLEGEEPTYDFEVPGAHSFIANGIVVHNSHAGAYALVAYQTAYFKANYPVEFMAALLTSEMGDTDKIVKYIEECRAMGIEVQPPDVNVSSVQFSVAGDTIRFGLAAIKNVGEAAMESILRSRQADGAFQGLEDFCARVDLRLVNRRVIESLIKAGAFDSLRLTRAHLLTLTDAALETGQRQQRERAEGQGSFFDLVPEAAPRPKNESTAGVPEWEADQRLAFEKDVLGFYISGHPLARFRDAAVLKGATVSGELGSRPTGSRVLLFGHVVALKETSTKSGNRMAFVTLEDTEGTVEVTVFPEPFKAAADQLRSREPLWIRGRIDDGDKGRGVLAEDVRLLETVLGETGTAPPLGEPNAVRIRVVAGSEPRTALAAVREICAAHPGRVQLYVHIGLPAQDVVVRARGVLVDASSALCERLQTLLGPTAVTVDYAGRA
jgi:DNA polymerase-3 subunit alpha